MIILSIEFFQNIKRRPPFYDNITAGIITFTFDDNGLPTVVNDLAHAGNVLAAFDTADIVHVDFQRRHLEAQGPAAMPMRVSQKAARTPPEAMPR